MKHIALSALLIIVLSAIAFAENPNNPSNKSDSDKPTATAPVKIDPLSPDALKTSLKLNETQYRNAALLWKQYQDKTAVSDNDKKMNSRDKTIKRRANLDEYIKEIRKTLTKEQTELFDKIVRENTPQVITPEQEKKMKEVVAKYRKLIDEVNNDPNLDNATKKEKIKALQEKMIDEMRKTAGMKTVEEEKQEKEKANK